MMRVDLYWNLHRNIWSVKCMDTNSDKYGRVLDYLTVAFMKDVDFIVREAGRQRVIKEGAKNIHAFARGILLDKLPIKAFNNHLREIMYNPFLGPNFYFTNTGEIVESVNYLFLGQNAKCYGC